MLSLYYVLYKYLINKEKKKMKKFGKEKRIEEGKKKEVSRGKLWKVF